MRSAAAARHDKEMLKGANKKFEAGKDPLELEARLGVIIPSNQQEEEVLAELVDKMLRDARTPAERNAYAMWKMQLRQAATSGAIKADFLRRFYFWLLGRGNDVDTKKTMWGRGNAAAHNKEVSLYIEQFARKRMEYALKLASLASKVPESLNEFYLYFKYIVNGNIRRVGTAGEGGKPGDEFWDMSNEDFLRDFEMFQMQFDATPVEDADGKPQKGPDGKLLLAVGGAETSYELGEIARPQADPAVGEQGFNTEPFDGVDPFPYTVDQRKFYKIREQQRDRRHIREVMNQFNLIWGDDGDDEWSGEEGDSSDDDYDPDPNGGGGGSGGGGGGGRRGGGGLSKKDIDTAHAKSEDYHLKREIRQNQRQEKFESERKARDEALKASIDKLAAGSNDKPADSLTAIEALRKSHSEELKEAREKHATEIQKAHDTHLKSYKKLAKKVVDGLESFGKLIPTHPQHAPVEVHNVVDETINKKAEDMTVARTEHAPSLPVIVNDVENMDEMKKQQESLGPHPEGAPPKSNSKWEEALDKIRRKPLPLLPPPAPSDDGPPVPKWMFETPELKFPDAPKVPAVPSKPDKIEEPADEIGAGIHPDVVAGMADTFERLGRLRQIDMGEEKAAEHEAEIQKEFDKGNATIAAGQARESKLKTLLIEAESKTKEGDSAAKAAVSRLTGLLEDAKAQTDSVRNLMNSEQSKHDARVDSIHGNYADRLAGLQLKHMEHLDSLTQKHAKQIEDGAANVADLKKKHEEETNRLKQEHEAETNKLKQQHIDFLEGVKQTTLKNGQGRAADILRIESAEQHIVKQKKQLEDQAAHNERIAQELIKKREELRRMKDQPAAKIRAVEAPQQPPPVVNPHHNVPFQITPSPAHVLPPPPSIPHAPPAGVIHTIEGPPAAFPAPPPLYPPHEPHVIPPTTNHPTFVRPPVPALPAPVTHGETRPHRDEEEHQKWIAAKKHKNVKQIEHIQQVRNSNEKTQELIAQHHDVINSINGHLARDDIDDKDRATLTEERDRRLAQINAHFQEHEKMSKGVKVPRSLPPPPRLSSAAVQARIPSLARPPVHPTPAQSQMVVHKAKQEIAARHVRKFAPKPKPKLKSAVTYTVAKAKTSGKPKDVAKARAAYLKSVKRQSNPAPKKK